MGKTCKIILFYVAFTGIFAILLTVLFQTLHTNNTLSSPGLSVRPMPPNAGEMIWYRDTDNQNYKYWAAQLDRSLEVYKQPATVAGVAQNKIVCDYNTPVPEGKVCDVNIGNWVPCTSANHYNYQNKAPCIFLKLDQILDWKPDFYNDTEELPTNMPERLTNYLKYIKVSNKAELDTVWLSCEGENPADLENIGPIQYIPRRGFPGYFFPFKNQQGYLSPVVAIFFERPKMSKYNVSA